MLSNTFPGKQAQMGMGLLLTDPSPCLRLLVLKDLFKKSAHDKEILELQNLCREDYLIKDILDPQGKIRVWEENPWITAHLLKRLAYLGFGMDHPVFEKAAAFIISHQNKNGSWTPGKSEDGKGKGKDQAEATLVYTAIILQALALCGYAETKEAMQAYTWLLQFRLPDGAWPAGVVEGNYRGVAGYRRLAHSQFGCRTTTTGITAALAYHPELRRSDAAKRALDLLLSTELKETGAIGCEVARVIGAEPIRGLLTYYVRSDSAFILDLCNRIGANSDDERVKDLIRFILIQQGPSGLWEYTPNPRASRWITFDIFRSFSHIDKETDWFSTEPRTPFRKYPKKQKRF